MLKVIGFSGSLRKESYTTKLLKAFGKYAPENVDFEIIDISHLPLLNQDLELNLPQAIKNLKEKVKNADGIILATPEYNRSYSPVIKNALDWGSRPSGDNSWNNKPAVVIGQSPFNLGAFGAQNHLRQVLMYLNVYPLQQPEFYLDHASEKFDEKGNVTDQHTIEKIKEVWAAFTPWIKKIESTD